MSVTDAINNSPLLTATQRISSPTALALLIAAVPYYMDLEKRVTVIETSRAELIKVAEKRNAETASAIVWIKDAIFDIKLQIRDLTNLQKSALRVP